MKVSVAIKLLIIVYAVGLAGFLIPSTSPMFADLTAGTILFSFLFLLFYHKDWSFKFLFTLFSIALVGFLIEYVGVETRMLFGSYGYGENLGKKLLGIPLLKGINWFLLIYCSRAIVSKLSSNGFIVVVLSSILMLCYDYVLEPFANHNDLWVWFNPSALPPYHNFAGWLVASLVLHTGYRSAYKQPPNPVALPLFFIQLLFFTIIGIVKGWVPYLPY
jgi:putative membrane protein